MDSREPGTEMLGESTDDAYRDLTGLIERWHGRADGRLGVAVSPRGTRTVTTDLWLACVRLADELDLRLHTHVNENQQQADRLGESAEGRDLVALDGWGALNPRLVMAHCVWLDQQERALLRARRPHVCHCPSSNLKLASGVAPIPDYLDDGINVALGADGAACNNRLDAFAEMRLAALLHKPRYGPRAMPAWRVLDMATMGGARALGMEHQIGSLEVGKRADVVMLRRSGLHTSPLSGWGPHEQVVYAHSSADVDTVVVDGTVVWQGSELTLADTKVIVDEAETTRAALIARAGLLP
jgi:cytosine/adenosine deaminase-related metal-dependent hydrolase